MKIDLSLNITRDSKTSPAAWRTEAEAILEEAAAASREPGIDAASRDQRLRWLGGAIRMFAVATGSDPEQVRERLQPAKGIVTTSTPPAQRPVASPLGEFVPPEKRPNRPPRHPGAQRPVADPPDLPADMFEGLPEFGGAEGEPEVEGSPTTVTASPPSIRSADDPS